VERIARQARDWEARHPEAVVVVGRELGPDERVARLVVERYDEARAGGASMNCDCCIYRTVLPGYEDRVGTPVAATPHLH
jgi:cobalt/nickel transport system ATP-binding protein